MASASLTDELGKAFTDNFEFKGDYHHFSTESKAPNPGLTIKGVGLVGLPLGERDAQAIASLQPAVTGTTLKRGQASSSSSSLVRPGVVTLDGTKVSFNNPHWAGFVDDLATKTVWKTLGVDAYTRKPRCELVKLSLHQPGTSSPLVQESPKADGAFATIVIVLPSECQGGQVHVSTGKGRTPTILDTTKNAAFTTSIIAWYNALFTSVQPVTSGYRIALTYSLIHTSLNTPKPGIPTAHTIDRAFRSVLQKWKDGKYMGEAKPRVPLMAYVLRGRDTEPSRGMEGLSARDAHIVKFVLPIAKSLGFSVHIASLKKKMVGIPHKDHFAYHCIPSHKRSRHGHDDYLSGFDDYEDYMYDADMRESYRHGDYDTPPMGDIESEEQVLSEVTSLDGGKMSVKLTEFHFDEDNLVPQDAFKNAYPEEESFDRDNGEVKLKYRSNALVLYRPEDETEVILAVKGPYWFLKQLEITSKPTTRANAVVSATLQRLEGKGTRGNGWYPEPDAGATAITLLNHATAWKQHALWNKAIPYCKGVPIADITAAIANAAKVFKLDLLKDGLLSLIKDTKELNRRFELVKAISSNDPKGSSRGWLEELTQDALSSCTNPTVSDVPSLVSVAQSRGPAAILSLIPKIEKKGTYAVLIALAKGLHELRQSSSTTSQVKGELGTAVRQCIAAAIPQWEQGLYGSYWNCKPTDETDKTKRICEIVELCYTIGDLQPCIDLLNSLLQFERNVDVTKRLTEIHTPLIPHLRSTLAKLGKPANSEPFASFYRHTISLYLSRVLRTKPEIPSLPSKPIGCGQCADCTQLDKFLRDATSSSTCFKTTQPRRTHVEAQIRKERYLANYVTTETVKSGSPHSLFVRKRPEVMTALKWGDAKAAAQAFVKGVCADERSLRELMGARYDDVVKAIEGTKLFAVGELVISGDFSAGLGADSSAMAVDSSVPVVHSAGGSGGGTKRKRK
ncbi:hypothetical protein DFP72DRAFT_1168981 [Ephemerocybe angulata]|uniref:Uncharacterized protein n=1 Tax=Ephemerocybe angulata TaxID=980116 RepID=A0A8H6I1L4_9AGAR|nr:hypothetical protein DFP72DRAFT_1168981 [Tulosesus angulatus]